MNAIDQLVPSFALSVHDAALTPDPLAAEQIIDGTPEVTGKVLWESPDGTRTHGIWQITPGVVTDTESDEMFVVVSGRATVAVEGGPTLHLAAGDVCVLREGDRTTWTIHETLRKVYTVYSSQ